MTLTTIEIQDKILETALEDISFDGWNWSVIENAAVNAGYEKNMAEAVFPEKIWDCLSHFADWADRGMLVALDNPEFDALRIRGKIELAVKKRLDFLSAHKEAVKLSSSYWAHPFRKFQAMKIIWRTADVIWEKAGDTAKDYNHYTKRGLLSGVIISTTLVWLSDESENHADSYAFLHRRIENVLQFGKVVSKIKPSKVSG